MNTKTVRKTISVFLTSILLVAGLLSGSVTVRAAISASSLTRNNQTRHAVCTSLSTQAQAYYTGSNTYEQLIQLAGTKTTDSTAAIGSALFNRLHSMMQLSDTVTYASLPDYWEYTDAASGTSHAWLFYSDVASTGTSSYNREHVWPKSCGNFDKSGAGSDLHHLRPTDSGINSTRGSYTFGNVRAKNISAMQTASYGGNTVLWYISDYSKNNCTGLVEVADNIKGDVARILLYVYVTYGSADSNKNLFTKCGSANGNSGHKIIESLSTLLDWNACDPVDRWEMRRNDLVQKVQGNRNVFIDYPELAWYLFGTAETMPVITTPSGKAASTVHTNYTVSAVSSNETAGTVSVSGSVITASPKEGYAATGYEVTSGAATVSQDGNTFTVTPSSDCTVKIIFEARQTLKVSLVSNGKSYQTKTVYSGESVELPKNLSDVNGWKFLGWVPSTVSETDQKPSTVYTESFTPATNTTLYALYANAPEGSGTGLWTRLSSTSELHSGLQIVFACSQQQVIAGALSGTFLSSVSASVFSGDHLNSLPTGAMVFTVGSQSGSWTFTSSAGQLYCSEVKKLNFSSSGTGTWTVTMSGQNAVVSSTSSQKGKLEYNSSAPRFTTYSSGQNAIQIYYLDGGASAYATNPPHTHNYVNGVCTVCGDTLYTVGDLDQDDSIGEGDVRYLLNHLKNPSSYPLDQEADFDGNHKTDKDDAVYLLYHLFFPEKFPIK